MTLAPSRALDTYRLLGRSGLRVSPLALGTMTFGTNWGWGADEREARRVFDAYVDRGGNFIDTGASDPGRRSRISLAARSGLRPTASANRRSGIAFS